MVLCYRLVCSVMFCLIFSTSTTAQRADYFDYGKGLRIDFVLNGSEVVPHAGLIAITEEPYWSAPAQHDIMEVDYGEYVARVYDVDKKLMFSRGFSSLFEEWLTTNQAGIGSFAFEQSLSIPFPKYSFELALFVRQTGKWVEFVRWEIDPNAKLIKPYVSYYQSEVIHILGNEANCKNSLDLTFVADGYTADQKEKAIADARHFAAYLVNQPPFNQYKDFINFRLAYVPSQHSGVTIPDQNIYRNTILESSFSSLGLSRYLTTERYFKLRSIASATPYDFVLVMVNTDQYGGGGIFNHFSVFSSDGVAKEKVFLHEFGHHFGGLADEYFNSEVPYVTGSKFLIEPWQPNVTTLVDFESKWALMVSDTVPIPTPRIEKYSNVTGAFEGGLYVSKGVYSPAMDCRMKSNAADGFCPVCQVAIIQMLEMYIVKK